MFRQLGSNNHPEIKKLLNGTRQVCLFSISFYPYCYILSFEDYEHVYCIVLYTLILQDGSCKTTIGPSVNVPIQRTAHLFNVIPANDTKKSMFGHQNVSLPAAGVKPDNLASEALTTRLPCFSVFIF